MVTGIPTSAWRYNLDTIKMLLLIPNREKQKNAMINQYREAQYLEYAEAGSDENASVPLSYSP